MQHQLFHIHIIRIYLDTIIKFLPYVNGGLHSQRSSLMDSFEVLSNQTTDRCCLQGESTYRHLFQAMYSLFQGTSYTSCMSARSPVPARHKHFLLSSGWPGWCRRPQGYPAPPGTRSTEHQQSVCDRGPGDTLHCDTPLAAVTNL